MKKIAAFALLVLSASAVAELSVSDYLNPYDGLITKDDMSGLYWLDLDYTSSGNSDAPNAKERVLAYNFENISKRTKTVGDVLYGFRHATLSEVEELFINAGMQITNGGPYDEDNFVAASQFLEKLGHTKVIDAQSGSVRKYQWGWTASTCGQVAPIICKNPNSGALVNIVIPGVSSYQSADRYIQTGYTHLMDKNVEPTKNLVYNTGHYLVMNIDPWLFRRSMSN